MSSFVRGPGSILSLVACLLAARAWAAGGHPQVDARQACVTLSCHPSFGRGPAASRFVHEPFSSGECASCHELTLAAGARLVRGAPTGPEEGLESVRAWDLALCTTCHGDEIYARDSPPAATGFVDGTRNLHTLHVQAGRGRRCLTCHEPHSSRQAFLLRERIPARGNARIAQEFRGDPKGGWCRTGCHAPKRYTR